MEDYREIGPPGTGETRKTGASNLARCPGDHTARQDFTPAASFFEVPIWYTGLGGRKRCHYFNLSAIFFLISRMISYAESHAGS